VQHKNDFEKSNLSLQAMASSKLCLFCVAQIHILPVGQLLHELVDLGTMYSVVFLPAFPGMVRILCIRKNYINEILRTIEKSK